MLGLAAAIHSPATRRSMRRRWLIVTVLALVAVAFFAAAAWGRHVDDQASARQRRGVPADATVVGLTVERWGMARYTYGSVEVEFDVDGQARQSSIYVEEAVSDYQEGQLVRIVYDADDPTHAQIEGMSTARGGVPITPPLAIGLILTVMALVAGRRTAAIGRVLRHEGWLFVRSRLVDDPSTDGYRGRARPFVVLDTPGGELMVEPVGLNRVDPSFAPELWTCGLGTRNRILVLAPPGGGHVVAVRRRPMPSPSRTTG
jgi:hypothetical protein